MTLDLLLRVVWNSVSFDPIRLVLFLYFSFLLRFPLSLTFEALTPPEERERERERERKRFRRGKRKEERRTLIKRKNLFLQLILRERERESERANAIGK